MPYEDSYKEWLEKMLIEMSPDWLCDGMHDNEFTFDWCEKYCGKEDLYITPKCLHIYYHHIARAEQTEPNSSENPNNCETCKHWDCIKGKWECVLNECHYKPKTEPLDKDTNVRSKEPQTVKSNLEPFRVDESKTDEEYINNLPWTDTDLILEWSCSFSECDNFDHFGFNERCVKCKQMQRKATEPQTDCAWKKGE